MLLRTAAPTPPVSIPPCFLFLCVSPQPHVPASAAAALPRSLHRSNRHIRDCFPLPGTPYPPHRTPLPHPNRHHSPHPPHSRLTPLPKDTHGPPSHPHVRGYPLPIRPQGTVVLVGIVFVLIAGIMLCTARRVPAWMDLPAICDALGARKIFGR